MKNTQCKNRNMATNWKTLKMRNSHGRTWNMGRYTEKHVKFETPSVGHGLWQKNSEKRWIWEIHTVGPGLWKENWKMWKNIHKNWMTWDMERSTKKLEKWEMPTVGPGICRETWKMWKMRNTHCRTLRKLTNEENEKIRVIISGIWQKMEKRVK